MFMMIAANMVDFVNELVFSSSQEWRLCGVINTHVLVTVHFDHTHEECPSKTIYQSK